MILSAAQEEEKSNRRLRRFKVARLPWHVLEPY
jgi:hypothetical protein